MIEFSRPVLVRTVKLRFCLSFVLIVDSKRSLFNSSQDLSNT